MIEMLSTAHTSPLSQPRSNAKIHENNTFQEQLDYSFSEQKALAEDLRLQKIEDQRKKTEAMSDKIRDLKKQYQKELNPKEYEKFLEKIMPLEDLLSFVQNTLQNLESIESSTGTVDLFAWVETLQNFITQSLEEISYSGTLLDSNYFAAQKFSSLLENIPPDFMKQESSASSFNNNTIKNTLMNIFTEAGNLIENFSKDELLVAGATSLLQKVAPDMELIEPIKIENNTFSEDALKKDTTLKSSEFMMDFSESSDDNPPDKDMQKIYLKDFRTKDSGVKKIDYQNLDQNVEKAFTLENMDAESSVAEGVDSLVLSVSNNNSVKNDTMIMAQKLYSALSSSISHVQVEALMQNMVGRISMILQDGGSELRMKLTPPELGNMKLSFISENGIMRGKIVVETPEAKMFFEQNINNLRESLAHAGIELGSIDIDLGSQSDFASNTMEESEGMGQAVRSSLGLADNNEKIEIKSMNPDLLVDFIA